MVIGSGGREHALVRGLVASPKVEHVICVPGNPGIGGLAENVPGDIADHKKLIALAQQHRIDLTVVGPEAPLCAGIVDAFEKAGLKIFGPTARAARIEGDKAYAKRLMKIAHVPTAEGRAFQRYEDAKAFVETRENGLVVKASGLAAGKGVFVCKEPAEALVALEQIMVGRAFGAAGDTVVVEELIKGEELSVFALVSGRTIYVLETAQDHKAIGDGDTGPNTGGMGAYSPAPIATADLMARVERDILVPIVDALRSDDAPYCGLLYAGLMITAGGPKVLEFNCRFGDPETQAVLMRLDSDLAEMLLATVEDRLDQIEIKWKPQVAVGVVMASQGYPGEYQAGKVITGLDEVARMEDVYVFHSGTKNIEHLTVTNGGRVLTVAALGDDIHAARERAYAGVGRIQFEGAYSRKDIGARVVQAR